MLRVEGFFFICFHIKHIAGPLSSLPPPHFVSSSFLPLLSLHSLFSFWKVLGFSSSCLWRARPFQSRWKLLCFF